MEKSETWGQNETKISLYEGNSACATFTGNGKGELMCWNSIPPSSHREGPAFHCQIRDNVGNLELVLHSLPLWSGFPLHSSCEQRQEQGTELREFKVTFLAWALCIVSTYLPSPVSCSHFTFYCPLNLLRQHPGFLRWPKVKKRVRKHTKPSTHHSHEITTFYFLK